MRQWVIELDTGRFGDWVVVSADSEEAARKQLTRSQKKKVLRVGPVYRAPQIDTQLRMEAS